MKSFNNPSEALKYHVTGAIERGEKTAIAGQPKRTFAEYTGPKLKLQYTDADELSILHHIPMSPGFAVCVVGNPNNGSYEWLIWKEGTHYHSDCGYGDSDIALRDGLIAMHGLPSQINELIHRVKRIPRSEISGWHHEIIAMADAIISRI